MDYDVLWHQYQLVTRDAIGMQSRAYAAEARVAKLEAECTHAKAELDNYKQWHEQEQIRAVDAEHQWGELVGERAVKAEARLAELEAAARWRPVDGDKPEDDAPVLALLNTGIYVPNGVPLRHWRGTGGSDKHVVCWRPITPPPVEVE